jgi:hypothetical protein
MYTFETLTRDEMDLLIDVAHMPRKPQPVQVPLHHHEPVTRYWRDDEAVGHDDHEESFGYTH